MRDDSRYYVRDDHIQPRQYVVSQASIMELSQYCDLGVTTHTRHDTRSTRRKFLELLYHQTVRQYNLKKYCKREDKSQNWNRNYCLNGYIAVIPRRAADSLLPVSLSADVDVTVLVPVGLGSYIFSLLYKACTSKYTKRYHDGRRRIWARSRARVPYIDESVIEFTLKSYGGIEMMR